MSNFEKDILSEKCVSDFLDKYYYPNTLFKDNIERVSDIERQMKGIDVIVQYNNQFFNIDEKSAISSKYKSLNQLATFSLEIDFISYANTISPGWLVKENLDTDFYLFNFLDRNREKTDIDCLSDIYFIETMLVSKPKLLNYLKSRYNLGIAELKEKGISFRREYNKSGTNNIHINNNNNNTRFYISESVSEKTFNLLLDRRELKSLSTFNHLVFSDSYNHLNGGKTVKLLKN